MKAPFELNTKISQAELVWDLMGQIDELEGSLYCLGMAVHTDAVPESAVLTLQRLARNIKILADEATNRPKTAQIELVARTSSESPKCPGHRSLDLPTIDALHDGLGDVEALLATARESIEDDDWLVNSLWAIEKIHTRTKKIFDSAVN